MKHKKGTALIEEQLATIAQYLSTPVATYTHTSNTEIVVSAVDVNTETFTSAGHGLANGDIIFPTLNFDAGAVYPLQVYAGGMTQVMHYIVNKTDNTFQLSLTSGGAAINLTDNVLMDLTKWHFESIVNEIVIADLPPAKTYKVIARNFKGPGAGYLNFYANTKVGADNVFAVTGQSSYSNPMGVTVIGTIATYLEFIISTVGKMFIKGTSLYLTVNAAQAAQVSTITSSFYAQCMTSYMEATDITSIIISFPYKGIANGSVVEVYKA